MLAALDEHRVNVLNHPTPSSWAHNCVDFLQKPVLNCLLHIFIRGLRTLDKEKWNINTDKMMEKADEYLEVLDKLEDSLK